MTEILILSEFATKRLKKRHLYLERQKFEVFIKSPDVPFFLLPKEQSDDLEDFLSPSTLMTNLYSEWGKPQGHLFYSAKQKLTMALDKIHF